MLSGKWNNELGRTYSSNSEGGGLAFVQSSGDSTSSVFIKDDSSVDRSSREGRTDVVVEDVGSDHWNWLEVYSFYNLILIIS